MDREIISLRKLAVSFLCLYAFLYPLLAHFLLNEAGTGGVGSAPVQLLQLATLAVTLAVGRFGRDSWRNFFNVWIVGALYFGLTSLYLAEFYAENEKFVEITYAARFIMWFLFAAAVTRATFEYRELEKLAQAFLAGSFIQGLLAVRAFRTQSVGSIYNEVYATTGGAYVSGKMIVSFVTLGMMLATYWLITRRRFRWMYLISICVAGLVILFSYNRANQLSLVFVLLYAGFWLFRHGQIRAFSFLLATILVVGLYLASSGDSFLLRWQNIFDDGGSGRVKLVHAALERFANPDSMKSLMFGTGYHQTKLLMYQACGIYIGTHSDLFDFLMVYGLVGCCFYLWVALKLLTLGRGLSSRSPEFLFIRSSGLFIVLTGLVTGLFQGTYTFFMFFVLCQYWYETGMARCFESDFIPVGYAGIPAPFFDYFVPYESFEEEGDLYDEGSEPYPNEYESNYAIPNFSDKTYFEENEKISEEDEEDSLTPASSNEGELAENDMLSLEYEEYGYRERGVSSSGESAPESSDLKEKHAASVDEDNDPPVSVTETSVAVESDVVLISDEQLSIEVKDQEAQTRLRRLDDFFAEFGASKRNDDGVGR